MAADYFVLVLVASMGVYQIAAWHAGLKGLCFFGRPFLQYVLGLIAVGGAFGWFYGTENRNWQHTVEGTQQLGLFLLAIVAAYLVTAIVASVIQARSMGRQSQPVRGRQHDQGFETLKHTTLVGGILSSLKREREEE
jgi:hypothetical protein